MSLVLLVHAVSTLVLVGVIWFVQVVHYPLMASVGPHGFATYERAHARRTSWIVVVPMLVEAITALWLAAYTPPGLLPGLPWIGLGLVATLWASTFLLQVPCHRRLESGFDPSAHEQLVATNWIRTLAWSARGILVLWMLWTAWPAPATIGGV